MWRLKYYVLCVWRRHSVVVKMLFYVWMSGILWKIKCCVVCGGGA